MGVDYYAYLVVGVEIPRELLYHNVTKKAFEHNYPPSMKYCPETGKPL